MNPNVEFIGTLPKVKHPPKNLKPFDPRPRAAKSKRQKTLGPILLLGGSGIVISGIISPLIWVISIVALLITTHEPQSIPKRRARIRV